MIQKLIHTFFKENNSIFISEKDIVMNFAFYLKNKYPDAEIKFELPFKIEYEQQYKTEILKAQWAYLDLFVTYGGLNYGFEFKYQTSKLALPDVYPDVYSDNYKEFELKAQGAQDITRFNFRKDIYRLEIAIKKELIQKGFAIILTNDKLLYENESKRNTLDQEYRFGKDIQIKGGHAKWISSDSKENINNKIVNWTQQKSFNIALPLKETGYPFEWKDYLKGNNIKNSIFKYGVVEV